MDGRGRLTLSGPPAKVEFVADEGPMYWVIGLVLVLAVLTIGFFVGYAARTQEVREAEARGREHGRSEVMEWLMTPDTCGKPVPTRKGEAI